MKQERPVNNQQLKVAAVKARQSISRDQTQHLLMSVGFRFSFAPTFRGDCRTGSGQARKEKKAQHRGLEIRVKKNVRQSEKRGKQGKSLRQVSKVRNVEEESSGYMYRFELCQEINGGRGHMGELGKAAEVVLLLCGDIKV